MFKTVFGKLALGAMLLLAVIGGTVATASAAGTHPGAQAAGKHPAAAKARQARLGNFLRAEYALAAKTIGISPADLTTALKNGQTPAQVAQAHNVQPQTVIDALVKDITAKVQARPAWAKASAAQQAKLTTQITDRVTNFVNNGPKPGAVKVGALRQYEFALAAKTIGINPADLKTAIKGGQTVAAVAQAHNVTPQTVIDALVKDLTAKAQARPGWAKLSAAQQTALTNKITARVTNFVNNTGKPATK